jgi:hypothetical protein
MHSVFSEAFLERASQAKLRLGWVVGNCARANLTWILVALREVCFEILLQSTHHDVTSALKECLSRGRRQSCVYIVLLIVELG